MFSFAERQNLTVYNTSFQNDYSLGILGEKIVMGIRHMIGKELIGKNVTNSVLKVVEHENYITMVPWFYASLIDVLYKPSFGEAVYQFNKKDQITNYSAFSVFASAFEKFETLKGYNKAHDVPRLNSFQSTTDIWSAIGNASVEVKFDAASPKYGRIFLEYTCQGRDGKWYDSGIRSTTADVWTHIIGMGYAIIFFKTSYIKTLTEKAIALDSIRSMSRGENPTKGAVITYSKLWN